MPEAIKKSIKNYWNVLLFTLIVTAAYLLGTAQTPFHPDESTQIFMSGDLEIFWQNPSALFWQPQPSQPLRQHYRLLDAPLARDLIGLGRLAAGLPATQVDWDWSKSWEENRQAGALPAADVLLASRLPIALLFPFSLLLFFATARSLGGAPLAWVSVVLLAVNALVLLHTRRAMAEGPLLFASTLTLWALVRFRKNLWLLAIPAALAFDAKQTSAGLVVVGLAAVLWPSGQSLRRRLRDSVLYGLVFGLVTLLLNPFLWAHPLQAGQAAINARANLSAGQMSFIGAQNSDQVLNTWLERLIGMISQLFIAPPAFADVGNYLQQTHAAEAAYLANPLNHLLRGFSGGGLQMLLTVYGCGLAIFGLRQTQAGSRRGLALLLAATLVQFILLLALIPLPFQRYYLPLTPFACLWSGYAIVQFAKALWKARRLANA